MKLTVFAFLLGTASMFGTTLQVFTGGPTAPQDIVDNTGASIVGAGFAAIGLWDGTALGAATTPADLAGAFSIGGYKFANGSDNTGVPIETFSFLANTADGFNVNNVTKASIVGAGDLGKKIAVAIWKGPDAGNLATATEATLFQLDQVSDNAATPTSINYLSAPGTLVFGTSKTQLAVLIPEPSSVLLLGLGGLGFLFRRKR